jgi:hypothetical protein
MMTHLYRKILPSAFRAKVYNLFLGRILFFCRNFHPTPRIKGLTILILNPFFPKNEYYDALRYVGKHGYSFYPFKKSFNYNKMKIRIEYDSEKNLPYIVHSGKRLYFPQNFPAYAIKNNYKFLRIEQDENSPHRYVKSYDELQGKILLDIGAAEGIFALDVIEQVEKVYLFECEDIWMEALRATFEPWKEKTEIVKKYVGDRNEGDFITIDTFMTGKEQNNIHIKMDIEGYEVSALNGAKNLLSNGKNISFSVCTYHRENDVEDISRFFESLGYSHQLTPGLLYSYPYLRKCVCRGNSNQ